MAKEINEIVFTSLALIVSKAGYISKGEAKNHVELYFDELSIYLLYHPPLLFKHTSPALPVFFKHRICGAFFFTFSRLEELLAKQVSSGNHLEATTLCSSLESQQIGCKRMKNHGSTLFGGEERILEDGWNLELYLIYSSNPSRMDIPH